MEVNDGTLKMAEGKVLVGAASDAALDTLDQGEVLAGAGLTHEVRIPPGCFCGDRVSAGFGKGRAGLPSASSREDLTLSCPEGSIESKTVHFGGEMEKLGRAMPRGNRFRLAGHVWHITDRCHRRQFLLKFARDRRAWVRWLYEARKRFGLSVLGYQVTHNHVHLVVFDQGRGEVARSMQLVEGCVGRAYNRRKRRRGAFWQEAYHATAVDTDEHLVRCLVYVDLNMVRAGVVRHPAEWGETSYHEIQQPKDRYRIVDRVALCELLGVPDAALGNVQNEWIESKLREGDSAREPQWSEVIAVGRRSFIEDVRSKLGSRARYRRVEDGGGSSLLREDPAPYCRRFPSEVGALSSQ